VAIGSTAHLRARAREWLLAGSVALWAAIKGR
jgi:hypothetical protein